MATSSLASTVPQLYPPTSGAHRRSQRRRSLVSLPASAAFTGAAPCLRLNRSQRSSPVLKHRFLANNSLRNRPGSIPVSRLHNSWKDGTIATGREAKCISCFKFHSRVTGGLSHLRRFTPGAVTDMSTFPSRTHLFGARLSGRTSHMTRASVGRNEPHAASPALSDTLLEKPDVYFLDQEAQKEELERLLNEQLPSHPKVTRGQLKNGLRYIILPNKNPANRFEAHMEVHVGSVDEEEDQQGIAHMIEHVTFLGSKKREKLLGTGARSNAYTDFHHTVFHIHSPAYSKILQRKLGRFSTEHNCFPESGEYLLPSVLDALNEIAFYPKFLPSRVEKERKAILSELQMMNTIEYRIDCQLLQHLHADNKLSQRFPIGLEEQIKKWDPDTIQAFHERWYYPANATLYLVGDIPSVTDAIHHIEAVFDNDPSPPPSPRSALQNPMAKLFGNNFVRGMTPSYFKERENAAKSKPLESTNVVKRERQLVRPPVEHEWSLRGSASRPKQPEIFQHELIPNFSLNMFAKVPVSKGLTFRDLRETLMKRIFTSALHFRINTRYKSSNPQFSSIDLDHSDSGREGCAVTTLTITSEPKNWRDAIKVAVHEVRRLKEFGVTMGEMTRYMDALIKDSEQLASMIDNIPSLDNLDFIMESDALGHTVMDQKQGYECLIAVAETVTLEEVNMVGKQMLEFISDYGQPLAPAPTAIVACVPKKVHVDGAGEADFVITSEEISHAIKEGLQEPIYPEPELEVPTELISTEQLEEMKLERKPSFVALDRKENSTKLFDEETGIVQRRLANGISINYKITPFEKNVGVMRLIACGGRATETVDSKGSVIVGVRALSEGGCVGNFSREQVELFCVNNLINCSLECTEECIFIEFRFSLRDNGMRAAFQLLHMVLEHNMWLEDAFDRARQLYLSFYRSIPKSLERSTAHRLMKAMLNGDERFVEPTPESLQELTVESVKDAVMSHFVGDNMELSIAGDFAEEELESCILDYLGTVRATPNTNLKNLDTIEPFVFRPFPSDLHFQQIRINDTDERACAYIAGPAPNRWGFTHDGKDLFEAIKDSSSNGEQSQSAGVSIRNHPLFFGVSLGLLAEIINSRLFTTVRDSLGLTYDVSFEVHPFDKLGLGWYVISVTSTPEKVQKAVDACKSVLRGLDHNKISQRELDRAKRTLLMKHIQDCESNNVYWLALMAHLQAKSVPRKDVSCIRDLCGLYEGATIDDIYLAYKHLGIDESSLFACIGISGANEPDYNIAEDEVEMELPGTIPSGRGRSTMTRPTT